MRWALGIIGVMTLLSMANPAAATSALHTAASPGNCVTCLGAPVDIVSTAAGFPLSGFRRVKINLRQHSKPELLFIGNRGGAYDDVGAERWPVVKALAQFGKLYGVSAAPTPCYKHTTGPIAGQTSCAVPTFDFSRARYASPYLTFVSKDLVYYDGTHFHPIGGLSSLERGIVKRYVHAPGESLLYAEENGYDLPLVAVGNYLQTQSRVTNLGDFQSHPSLATPYSRTSPPAMDTGLPFSTIHDALVSGKDPSSPTVNSRVVETVNAEANIITALICHADGKRPGKVCSRPAIRSILKSVK